MLKKSLSKKFKQKRANAKQHKSQTKLISRFIYTCYRKKEVEWRKKKRTGSQHHQLPAPTPFHILSHHLTKKTAC